MDTYQRISRRRILAAAVIDSPEDAAHIARSLLEGGLDVMEVTFRNPHAAECIRRIRAEVPDMWVGAGTLLTPAQIDEAMVAGACFGVSPGFNPSVVRAANDRGFTFIPGVFTPGEMEQSLELGCPWVKFFPAGVPGAIDYLKSISAPYAHTPLRIVPLGGVSAENLLDYLSLPTVPAVGGSWLTDRKLVAAKDWTALSAIAKSSLDHIRERFDR